MESVKGRGAVEDQRTRLADVPASIVLTRHMPGLDLLRGVAILMVVVFHGMAFIAPKVVWHTAIASTLFRLTGFGWTGVNLFFSLSGFLITGNLLDSTASGHYYARFYIRRALRILPAYFLVLLILGVTHTATWNYLAVCVIFLANWPKLLLHGKFVLYGVLWSLAVEEQFYTVWPWLVRRLRGKGLLLVCLAIMAICPILRVVGVLKMPGLDVFSKPFMIGDNLAAGAVIALLCRSPRLRLRGLLRLGAAVSCATALGLLVLVAAGHSLKGDALGAGLGYSMMEWLTAGLVVLMLCAYRDRPVQPALRFLVFFGKISYGLYLVHMLCGMLFDRYFGNRYLVDGNALLVRFVVANGLAILLATLSQRYFEAPILRLKRKITLAD